MSASCSLCDAPVIHARTVKNKHVELDATPDPRGKCWFNQDRRVEFASKANPRPATGRFFRLHMLTCEVRRARDALEKRFKEDPTDG